METAMQKLKRISNNLHEQYYEDITLKWLIDNIDDFIKEEKEQIMDAYWQGAEDVINADTTLGEQSEEYYNEFYNQNK